jgi:hypothetical protein
VNVLNEYVCVVSTSGSCVYTRMFLCVCEPCTCHIKSAGSAPRSASRTGAAPKCSALQLSYAMPRPQSRGRCKGLSPLQLCTLSAWWVLLLLLLQAADPTPR